MPQTYKQIVDKNTPKPPLLKNCVMAFLIGGLICLIGQGFYELYLALGITDERVKMLVPVTLILLGCLATAFGFYDKLAVLGGAGTHVPITGFANAMLAPSLEFKTEGQILGTASKMFSVSGPVIVFGILAGFIYGVFIFVRGLF